MTRPTQVQARCAGCGADQVLPATLVTLVVDLVWDEARVGWQCQLCGHQGEVPVPVDTQLLLLDGGCQLAAREPV